MVGLSTLLVPMTYVAGLWLWESRRVAVIAAILAIAAGPLLLMYPLVESFAPFGVAGGLALLSSVRAVDALRPGPWLVLAGVAVGVASLIRLDGVLLAVAPATAWMLRHPMGRSGFASPSSALMWGIASATAFLLVVAPWLLRNLATFDTALPSPGGRLLWIREYNEQFSVSLDLTLDRYWSWGLLPIVVSKVTAAVELAGRALGLLGGIFGVGFVGGLLMYGRARRLLPFTAYFATMFASMVLVFTEHGPKGAFIHSAPAWLPIALPLAVAGMEPVANWVGKLWPFLQRPQTHRFLEVVGAGGAIALTVGGAMALLGPWQERREQYETAAAFLRDVAEPGDVLLADDPSSMYLLTGLRGLAAPYDPFDVIGDVISRYGVDWIVVIRGEGAEQDPLGLWDGSAAVDATGNSPDFLPGAPAFDGDDVRVFSVHDTRRP